MNAPKFPNDAKVPRFKILRDVWRDLLATNDSADPAPRGRSSASPNRTLFGEILDFMLAPLLLLWPLSIAITFVVARSLADAPFDRALEDRLLTLAQEVKAMRTKSDFSLTTKELELVTADEEDKVVFQVMTTEGTLIAGEPNLRPPSLYDFPESNRAKLRYDLFNAQEVRVAYIHLTPDNDADGRVTMVQVAETLDKRVRLANEIVKGVILPQFIILPISVVLVWVAIRRGLRPLRRLRGQINSRSSNDMSPVDTSQAPDEVLPLIDSFNELLERVSKQVRLQRRFIADAAHQIKTPLAGIRTQAELAQRAKSPEDLAHSLELLSQGSARAARLVSQLLSLARAEHQREIASFESLNLVILARAITADWFSKAKELNIDLGIETSVKEAWVRANSILITELLGNLIDNAIRYAGTGALVTVRVESDGTQVRLSVEDNGPGIAHEELELIFQRFYRAQLSSAEGSGLGLAIVKEIAELHSGHVTVQSRQRRHSKAIATAQVFDAGWTCFTVFLPSTIESAH